MGPVVEVPEGMWIWFQLILLGTASASPLTLQGLDRVYVDVQTLELKPQSKERQTQPQPETPVFLVLDNPHTERATVQVAGITLGELLPRQQTTVSGVPAGTYTVVWTLSSGLQRTQQVGTSARVVHED